MVSRNNPCDRLADPSCENIRVLGVYSRDGKTTVAQHEFDDSYCRAAGRECYLHDFMQPDVPGMLSYVKERLAEVRDAESISTRLYETVFEDDNLTPQQSATGRLNRVEVETGLLVFHGHLHENSEYGISIPMCIPIQAAKQMPITSFGVFYCGAPLLPGIHRKIKISTAGKKPETHLIIDRKEGIMNIGHCYSVISSSFDVEKDIVLTDTERRMIDSGEVEQEHMYAAFDAARLLQEAHRKFAG